MPSTFEHVSGNPLFGVTRDGDKSLKIIETERGSIAPRALRLVTNGNVGQAPCHLVSSLVEMKLALAQAEESQRTVYGGNQVRIIHECRREAPQSSFLVKRISLGIRAYG